MEEALFQYVLESWRNASPVPPHKKMQHGTLPMYHGTLPMYHGTSAVYHGTSAVYHGTFSYGTCRILRSGCSRTEYQSVMPIAKVKTISSVKHAL